MEKNKWPHPQKKLNEGNKEPSGIHLLWPFTPFPSEFMATHVPQPQTVLQPWPNGSSITGPASRWGRGFPECTAMCASRTSGNEWTPESGAARELENTRVTTAVSFCPGLWRICDWSSAHHWPSGSLNPLCAFSFQRSTVAWREIRCRGDTYWLPAGHWAKGLTAVISSKPRHTLMK